MAKQLGRWKCSTSLIGPRDGALLTGLPDPVRTADAAPPRRSRDQEDPQPGALVCTIRQVGKTGEWSGEDFDGNPLAVHSGANGWEIRHAENGAANAHSGAPGELGLTDPLAAAADRRRQLDQRRLAASIAPARDADQQNPASIRASQRLMDSHYGRRD
jgi:hypothetical protein